MFIQLSLQTVLNLTWDNFNETADKSKYMFVKFFDRDCEHCKKIAPVIEALSNDSPVVIAEVDGPIQYGLRVRFNITGYPTMKLFKGQEVIADYKGKRTPEAIREWLTSHTVEFMVKATKEELKADSKRRKLDIFFTVHAPAASYEQFKTDMKQYGGFWYFVESVEQKIVANRQGYQFTLNDLAVPQKIQRFVAQHSLPFLPFMTAKNMEELRIAGKQLAFLIQPNEEVKKIVELNQVSANFKELSKFQFVETSREFVSNITHQTYVDGMLVVFFSDKNPLKLKMLAKQITNDKDLLQVCQDFDATQMEVIEIETEEKEENEKPEKKEKKEEAPHKKEEAPKKKEETQPPKQDKKDETKKDETKNKEEL